MFLVARSAVTGKTDRRKPSAGRALPDRRDNLSFIIAQLSMNFQPYKRKIQCVFRQDREKIRRLSSRFTLI
jgi:hypothetical protein